MRFLNRNPWNLKFDAKGPPQPATIDYSTQDDTAEAGTDYVETTGSIEFGVGESEVTIVVPTLNDGAIEATESLQLSITDPNGTMTINNNIALGYIGDVGESTVISVADASTVQEGDSEAIFVISYSGQLSEAIVVSYTTVDISAKAGSDYEALSGQIEFVPGGSQQVSISVQILDDSTFETDETFQVEITDISGPAIIGKATGQVTIEEDAVDTRPVIAFAEPSIEVIENAGTINIPLQRTGDNNVLKSRLCHPTTIHKCK